MGLFFFFSSWVMKNKIHLVNRQETQTTAFIYAEGALFMNLFFLNGCKTPGERCWTAPPLADMVCSEQTWRRAWVCDKFC